MNRAQAIDKVTTAMNGFQGLMRRAGWRCCCCWRFRWRRWPRNRKTFATPEAAVDALMAALKADDDAAMLAIFGEKHKSLVVTPDHAANSASRAELLAACSRSAIFRMRERTAARSSSATRPGRCRFRWCAPAALALRHRGRRRGIINRRIGANESNAIAVLRAYLDAQREYASRDRDGDGVLQYARKLASTPGKHDGLYWEADATGRGSKPVRTADRRERGVPQGPQGRRSVPRLSLPYFDRQGKTRPAVPTAT